MTTGSSAATTVPVRQHTLKQSTSWQGNPWRRRRADRLEVHPAEADSGVRFVYHGAQPDAGTIAAHWDAVTATRGGVVLANHHGASLRGAIPLLAALRALGIDNAVVEVHGPRIPAEVRDFTGYLELLAVAGLESQDAARRLWCVVDKVEVRDSFGFVELSPAARFHANIDLTTVQPDGQPRTLRAAFLSNLDEPHSTRTAPTEAGGEASHNPSGGDRIARPLWEIDALPEALQARAIEMLGHLALAGAPLAGYVRAHGSGPPLYQALLHAGMERRALTLTTVDAQRLRPGTATRGSSGPLICAAGGPG